MTNSMFSSLFGGPERKKESKITRREMDLAASIQKITEEVVIKMANYAYKQTGLKNLVMSGGVALNCVCNGKLINKTPFDDFHFQPASGDAGGSIGCALQWYYENYPNSVKLHQPNAYLGPSFSNKEVLAFLNTKNITFHKFKNQERSQKIAQFAFEDKIIGHFDGRMEFGPRALGNRSIIANPLNQEMQSKLNLKIKYRESFRPFAPIYDQDKTEEYFEFEKTSPYMLVVSKVKQNLLIPNNNIDSEDLIKIVNHKRSKIPAITHVDNSARLQSVNSKQNGRIHEILKEFEKLSRKAILINTSFNVRGEPIVCSLNDAYTCFMRTEMDVLVINDYFLLKEEQANFDDAEDWTTKFELD